VLRGVISKENGQFLRRNVPEKPNTPRNCELDWSMQRRAHDIASVGRVYYRPRKGWVGLHTAGEV